MPGDSLTPTARNRLLGMLADAVKGGADFVGKPFGYDNPPAQMLTRGLGIDDLGTMLDRASYGERLTSGKGQTLRINDEVPGAIAALIPGAQAITRIGPRAAAMATDAIAAGARNLSAPSEMSSQAGKVLFGGVSPTVKNAQRVAFPGIYEDPRAVVAKAASNVAPENPLMKQLFGVSRDDLYDISQQGSRPGNIHTGSTDYPFKVPPGAKGAAVTDSIITPANTQRLQDIIGEASNEPGLYKGMASWYTMDPLYQHFERLFGPEAAVQKYNQFNTLTGMSSPGSEVLTELNRGTAANWLQTQGRFKDFVDFAGRSEGSRGADFPDDMRGVMGHAYHKTAQAGLMAKYLESGALDMDSAKVPSYIAASGVPETGFQTTFPVGDAHWSRLMGLADVRGQTSSKGIPTVPGAAASVPEMADLGPYFRDDIATPMGLQAVPGQAVLWGAGSHATGVTSPIGAPKLELLAQQIGKAAQRMNVSPEVARDMILRGQAHAGQADNRLLNMMGGGGALGAGGYAALNAPEDPTATDPAMTLVPPQSRR